MHAVLLCSTSAWYLLALCTTRSGRVVDTYESHNHNQGIGIGNCAVGETSILQTVDNDRIEIQTSTLPASRSRGENIINTSGLEALVPWADTREWSPSYARVGVHGLVHGCGRQRLSLIWR